MSGTACLSCLYRYHAVQSTIMNCNIGFVSFRIAGTDGVSLEILKWAEVFEASGHTCFYLAGELDTAQERSMEVEALHFLSPGAQNIHDEVFRSGTRPPLLSKALHFMKEELKQYIDAFVQRFKISLLVVENVFAIPLHLAFTIALTEYITETGIQTIGHHHDFYWERQRFQVNNVWDKINANFPPFIPEITHVVINSSGQHQLGLRRGISSILIPNVMPFEREPRGIDDYNNDLRGALRIPKDHLFILQPTRIVPRKGIEDAIELVNKLSRKASLVISHASGDEGDEYKQRIIDYAALLSVPLVFGDGVIGEYRDSDPKTRKKTYSLDDCYPHADLVTYPSRIEGFGNAFLEAVYHRKLLLINSFPIYVYDIKPKNFKTVEYTGFITKATLDRVEYLLNHSETVEQMVEHNYALGKKHYSFSVLKKLLNIVFTLATESHL